MIDMAEKTLKEQIQDSLKECKDDKEYYEMYDVYDVDCDDGTYGDKILVPKNKMITTCNNKKKENEQ